MTIQTTNIDAATGVAVDLTSGDEVVFTIAENVILESESSAGVFAENGQSFFIYNNGGITADDDGVILDNSNDQFYNEPTGTVSGLYGVYMEATAETFVNYGAVSGDVFGVQDTAGSSVISNYGTIEGDIAGFFITAGSDTITNSTTGTIGGGISIASGSDTITNGGGIDGSVTFTGSPNSSVATNDSLDNSGSISAGFTAGAEGVVFEDGGGDELSNTGEISATEAVLFNGDVASPAATNSSLDNSGSISAGFAAGAEGVVFEDGGGDDLSNTGTISATEAVLFNDDVGLERLENSGTIEGGDGWGIAIFSSAGIDIVNSGLITDSAPNTANTVDGEAVIYFDDGTTTPVTLDNEGTITGSGYVIQSFDALDLTNSGKIHGGLYLSAANDSITNSHTGTIAGPIHIEAGGDTITNAGSIDGAITFAQSGAANKLTNSGSITGNVTLAASTAVANHGQIYGDVTLSSSDTLVNTGTIHGDVTLKARDTFNLSTGIVTGVINASTTDLFEFSGAFGNVTFDDFVAGSATGHDTIQFAANDFGTFAQVQAATSQVGADVVTKLDATDSITLNNVTLSSLVSGDFKFV